MGRSFRDLFRACHQAGWRIERRSNGHLALWPADRAKDPVIVSGTPGDIRAIRHAIADVRRAGLEWPRPRKKRNNMNIRMPDQANPELLNNATPSPARANAQVKDVIAANSGPTTTFRAELKRLRITHGLKQRELAELLGVSENTVGHWEQGHPISRDSYSKLLDMFPALRDAVPPILSTRASKNMSEVRGAVAAVTGSPAPRAISLPVAEPAPPDNAAAPIAEVPTAGPDAIVRDAVSLPAAGAPTADALPPPENATLAGPERPDADILHALFRIRIAPIRDDLVRLLRTARHAQLSLEQLEQLIAT